MVKSIQLSNQDDYTENFAPLDRPRVAWLFLIDTSASMIENNAIDDLTNALNNFIENASKDLSLRERMDIAVIEFNSTVRVVQDFIPVSKMGKLSLTADGGTSMGEGIELAIQKVKERTRLYQNMGVHCYKPWIIMFADDVPTDNIESAIEQIKIEESKNKLSFWAIGAPGCHFQTLKKLTIRCIELDLKEHNNIFSWIFDGMKCTVGEPIQLSALPYDSHIISDDWE